MGGEDAITQLILDYRYWILIPLTFIEGPVIAFVAGTMAAVGFFNIYALALLFFARDMALDAAYYAAGYYGGQKPFAQKMLRRLGITPDHLDEVRTLWDKHAGKTMFIGKLSYGIATAFIVVAGMIKMPLPKFFKWGAIVAIIQYWGLLLLGFFFGNAFGGKLSTVIENLHYVLLGGTVLLILYYGFSWYMRGQFFKAEREEATHRHTK